MKREVIIADTSYVGAAQRVAERRVDYGWPRILIGRLKAAKVAVSVVTVGEARSGVLRVGQVPGRARASLLWLDQFARVEVDEEIAMVWARIDRAGRSQGLVFSDNDLWIAATAQALGVPIVTCDRAFVQMPELEVEVVYLPSNRPAATGELR